MDILGHSVFSERERVMLIFGLKLSVMPLVRCPQCGKEVEFSGNENRPFCSERCKLLDFGAWADEDFALPADESELSEQDIDRIQETLEEGSKQ